MKESRNIWVITLFALILKELWVSGIAGFDWQTALMVGIETIIIVGISVIIWYITLKGDKIKILNTDVRRYKTR